MTKRDKKQSNNPPKDDGPKKTTKPITKKTIKLVSLQPDKRNTKQNTKQTTKHNNNQTINHNHSQPTRRNRPPAGSARGNAKKNGTKKFNYLVEELELPDGKTYLELATSPLDTDELGGGEQTFEFQEGFMVEGDQTPLSPFTWGATAQSSGRTRSKTVSWPLVFSLLSDPTDADAPLKNKIAIVKDKGPNDDEPVDENYSFNLFTYADASQQSSHKYVFSGSNQSVIPGGHVMSNTFIPLKILDTRLCGDWPGRQQAYTRDWLTFCAYTVALELEKPEQDQRNIHDLLPNELVPKYQDAQELKRKLSQWDGSHLVARDSAGSVPAMAGAKFLYHLLHRDDMKSMSASKVARHIFIRWCLVAHIAASVAKEPFSVKARFWKIPKEAVLNRNLELVYQMVPDLLTWTVKPEILGDKSISKDLINSLKLFANQGHRKKINEKWGKFMAVVFDAVTVPGIKARLALPTDNLQNMVLLGSHPQGYYNTYIGKNDLESLISKGYTWGSSHPFPTNMQPDAIVPFPRGTRLIKPSVYATKPTTISKTNIKIAGNWPRIRTQNAVMDNISANEIAFKIWDNDTLTPRPAEWLHRSAYSFGGNGKPDSAQEPENLVFGTFEANTEMIRFESYLKRIANGTFKTETEVTLRTEVNTHDSKVGNGKSLPWLTPQLFYQWTFHLNEICGSAVLKNPTHGQICRVKTFDLFSQSHPMLFEVDVDEVFDAKLAGADKELRDVVALFLFSQSELGAAYSTNANVRCRL